MSYQDGFDYQPFYGYPPPTRAPMRAPRAPHYEIVHVTGRNGAEAFQMDAGSNILLLDDTAPLVWFCQTDGAGYKTITPYTITPYVEPTPVSMEELNERLARLEEMLSAKSDSEPVKQPSGKRKPEISGDNA